MPYTIASIAPCADRILLTAGNRVSGGGALEYIGVACHIGLTGQTAVAALCAAAARGATYAVAAMGTGAISVIDTAAPIGYQTYASFTLGAGSALGVGGARSEARFGHRSGVAGVVTAAAEPDALFSAGGDRHARALTIAAIGAAAAVQAVGIFVSTSQIGGKALIVAAAYHGGLAFIAAVGIGGAALASGATETIAAVARDTISIEGADGAIFSRQHTDTGTSNTKGAGHTIGGRVGVGTAGVAFELSVECVAGVIARCGIQSAAGGGYRQTDAITVTHIPVLTRFTAHIFSAAHIG